MGAGISTALLNAGIWIVIKEVDEKLVATHGSACGTISVNAPPLLSYSKSPFNILRLQI